MPDDEQSAPVQVTRPLDDTAADMGTLIGMGLVEEQPVPSPDPPPPPVYDLA